MSITFRKLTAGDTASYRAVRLECLKAYPDNFGSTYESQSKLPKMKFEEILENPQEDSFMIGAFDQRELIGICGFLAFFPDNKYGLQNCGIIIQVYVRPSYQGRKIGLNLMKATIVEAFKLPQIDQIYLEVVESNMSAIRTYEQAGLTTFHPPQAINEGSRRMIIGRTHP